MTKQAWRLTDGLDESFGKTSWACLFAMIVLFGLTSSTWAQLSIQELDAFHQQAEAEQWTFSVGMSDAARRPLNELCGLVEATDKWADAPFDPLIPKQVLPSSFDWRDLGACPPIRDQSGCGSCWAFAAIGAMESAVLINEGVSADLSEQWLVSCRSGGCGGGSFASALNRLRCDGEEDPCGATGAVPEAYLPYQAANLECGCPYPHPHCIRSWSYVGDGLHPPSLTQIKHAIMTYGPVAAGVYVTGPFQAYTGGVFNACLPTASTNHAVVLVGWDDNQGANGVWMVRNSWGTDWGEHGYMRIEYGCLAVGSEVCYVDYEPADCNDNGTPDLQDITSASSGDCNVNGVPDECDIATGALLDQDNDGIPDECVVLFVDTRATGNKDGTSWANAYTNLQDALHTASDLGWLVREIRVTQGTYTPDQGANQIPYDRTATFRLLNGVTLKGGYAGPADPDRRDLRRYVSVLSGDLRGDDAGAVQRDDNSYHVITGARTGASAVLDGFTIEGGHAGGGNVFTDGGGMYNVGSCPTLINCTFRNNSAGGYGGAMYNADFSSPTLTKCAFYGNATDYYGGGVYNFNKSDPIFVDCTFRGNVAGYAGGGVMNFSSSPLMSNCLFDGNSAGSYGGGMLSYSRSRPIVRNCTFHDCSASNGGGAFYCYESSLTLLNSILWGNSAQVGPAAALYAGSVLGLSFSDVEGGEVAVHASDGCERRWGEGNMDVDPLFVPGPAGWLYLSHSTAGNPANSLCSGAGSDTSANLGLSLLTTRSDERVDVDVVDLGYHYPLTHVPLVRGDFDRDHDVDVADLAALQMCFADQELDGVVSPPCRIFDMELDGDVDLDDFAAIVTRFGAPQ